MKEIGGYFELELNKFKEYYPNALKLNSGRNALWYILKTYKPKSLYIPYYICDSVLEPINNLKIKYKFYPINHNFEPILDTPLKEEDFILYVNYFGINDEIVKKLAKIFDNLIIDNSQAFYSPLYKYPTFNSPRKFFGVPDGAYLFTNKFLDINLEISYSYNKCAHLIKKYDLGSNANYDEYVSVEKSFSNEPIKLMSNLTHCILSSINYEKIKKIREKNFRFIHKNFKNVNELNINSKRINGPMKYPLLITKNSIKEHLINNKIYISTYWNEVLNRVEKNSFEYNLTKFLIPLPIDQRYDINDILVIIEKLNQIL